MLEKHSGSDGIDISLPSSSRATHLTNGAKRGGGGEPLVHETHRHAGTFLQLGSDVARFDGAGRVLAVLVERQTDDESLGCELIAPANYFGDRRSLAAPAFDEAGRGGNSAGRIAHREADATVTIVDSQDTNWGSGIGDWNCS
jgi:hypothetical protein